MHIGIPFARSINPVTGTNWQGTGVVPDVAVPEAEAYDVAYAKALRHVLAMDDVPPPIADEARAVLAGLESAGGVDLTHYRRRPGFHNGAHLWPTSYWYTALTPTARPGRR